MQAPQKQISVILLLFQPVSGLLAQEQTQKLRQEVAGSWLQRCRPLNLQRRKHIPFWFCKIKNNPNQPYHQHLNQHWFNHMLLTHHIGSLNLWLDYICNKRFHHFHIAVTQPKPWGLLSMYKIRKEQSRKCRLEFFQKMQNEETHLFRIAEIWDFDGNGFNKTWTRTNSFENPFKSQIFTCRDRIPADL